MDLMKGIIDNIRNGKNDCSKTVTKKSSNRLIAMLEEFISYGFTEHEYQKTERSMYVHS